VVNAWIKKNNIASAKLKVDREQVMNTIKNVVCNRSFVTNVKAQDIYSRLNNQVSEAKKRTIAYLK